MLPAAAVNNSSVVSPLFGKQAMPRLIPTVTCLPVRTENLCSATALEMRSAMPSAMTCEAIGMMATNSSPA
jgi:hypothetical protein